MIRYFGGRIPNEAVRGKKTGLCKGWPVHFVIHLLKCNSPEAEGETGSTLTLHLCNQISFQFLYIIPIMISEHDNVYYITQKVITEML